MAAGLYLYLMTILNLQSAILASYNIIVIKFMSLYKKLYIKLISYHNVVSLIYLLKESYLVGMLMQLIGKGNVFEHAN